MAQFLLPPPLPKNQLKPARPRKSRASKAPTAAVFEEIINGFVEEMPALMNKAARAQGRNNSDFCCVIGPTVGAPVDEPQFTMSAVDREELVKKLATCDTQASEDVAAPLDSYMVRIVVFLKGVIFVKDVYFMPAPNSRGGSA